MGDKLGEGSPKMTLVQWNEAVEACIDGTPDAADIGRVRRQPRLGILLNYYGRAL
jgi:hypothetical protein